MEEYTITKCQFLSNYISYESTEFGVIWVVEREQDGETNELGSHDW